MKMSEECRDCWQLLLLAIILIINNIYVYDIYLPRADFRTSEIRTGL